MQIKIEILKKGDEILNVWDNNIAVKKKNGDVEIFRLEFDEMGLPRISDDSFLITQGDGVISTKNEDGSIKVGTF